MYTFQFLPHTADISIDVEADTLEELFLASLLGMNEVLREGFCDQSPAATVEQPISMRSIDTTSLLIDFLSVVLTHGYLEKAMFCTLDIKSIHRNSLEAVIRGTPVDYFSDDIKAVTYHGAEVVHQDGKWRTSVIFDI